MNAVGSTRRQRGATLIEHVVALAVLAVVVVSVFTLLSVGYLARSLAQDQSVATHLAQRKLEEFRSGGVDAATTMVRQAVDPAAFHGYAWQVDVVEVAPRLKQVEATVFWLARGRERRVRLLTLLGD